jgi:hypothetical protein
VQLSVAMKSTMVPAGRPLAGISPDVGGLFSLFGGYIAGRQVELMPHERIVQAWRTLAWHPGVYSIVKFELSEQGSGTKLVLDHAGFPDGLGRHLADGWKENYWEPLEKYLIGRRVAPPSSPCRPVRADACRSVSPESVGRRTSGDQHDIKTLALSWRILLTRHLDSGQNSEAQKYDSKYGNPVCWHVQ